MSTPIGERIGEYEVLSELGTSPVGTVFLGLAPLQHVALHRLHERPSSDGLRRLRSDVARVQSTRHLGIVAVLELLEADRTLVTEFVHGASLRHVQEALSAATERMFVEAIAELGSELGEILHAAWTAPGPSGEPLRLGHHALRPGFVIVTPTGDAKLTGWALAGVEGAASPAKLARGEAVYLPPEAARGDELDARADLYSLGAILYELLCEEPLVRARGDGDDARGVVLAAAASGEIERACRALESKVPGVGSVVGRLCSVEPRDRYASGHDLASDLRRQLTRDRGAHLREFCRFAFGGILRLPSPPVLPGAPRKSMPSGDKRKSMEERLRESMEKATHGSEGAPAPARPAAPVRRVPRHDVSAPKITARSESAQRVAPPPEKDDLVPPSVLGRGGKKDKLVGSRDPNETGMLQMVPLAANNDEQEVAADPSATAFFAIPAPKSERPKGPGVSGSMAPPGGLNPVASSPGPFVPPSGPASMVGSSPGPFVAPGMGGPQSLGPGGGPMVQGPVAGHGPGGPQSVFAVSGPGPAPGGSTPTESRMQSTRVFAIVLAAFGLMGVALVMAVVAWFYLSRTEEPPPPAPVVASAPAPAPTRTRDADTGTPRQKAPAPRRQASAAPAAPREAPAPRASNAAVTITFAGDIAGLTGMEITCTDGFRQRGPLSGTSVTIGGVPTAGDCVAIPKGKAGTKTVVRGGGHYSCQFVGTTMSCR